MSVFSFILSLRTSNGDGGLVAKSCWTLAIPWTIACQAPLSMGFPRQECWGGLPFPSPVIFPNQGLNLGLLHCRQILYQLSYQGRCKWQNLLTSVFSVNLGWYLPQGVVGISLFLEGIDFLQKSSPHLRRQRRDLLQSWKPQVCLGSCYSLCRTEKIFCLVLHGMARSLT